MQVYCISSDWRRSAGVRLAGAFDRLIAKLDDRAEFALAGWQHMPIIPVMTFLLDATRIGHLLAQSSQLLSGRAFRC